MIRILSLSGPNSSIVAVATKFAVLFSTFFLTANLLLLSTIYNSNQDRLAVFTNYCVTVSISLVFNSALLINNLRPLINADGIFDLTTTIFLVAPGSISFP